MQSESTQTADTAPRGRVLVVDDEPSVRLSFRLALETEGWQVDDAEDSDQALVALADDRAPYDAMVLDYRMPGRTGVDLAEELQRRNIFVPTTLASAHLDEDTVAIAVRHGVADFLRKPVSLGELRGGVARLVEDEQRFVDVAKRTAEDSSDTGELSMRVRGHIRRCEVEKAATILEKASGDCLRKGGTLPTMLATWEAVIALLSKQGFEMDRDARRQALFDLLADAG